VVTNVLYDFLNFFAINLKEFARKLEYFPNYQKKPSTHDYGRVEGPCPYIQGFIELMHLRCFTL